MGKIEHLKSGLTTAFIDRNINSNLAYQPEFVSNDYHQGKKVQSTIEQELKNCDEFCISVAFITESGIAPFLMILKELEAKNIPGKILTTDYLTFSNPKALKKLAELKNIDLRMYRWANSQVGFHTKGYIFEKDEMYRIIIGSSNLTGKAISVNKEWNTKLVGTKDGALIKDVLTEFEQFWNDEKHTEKFEAFIGAYEEEYERLKMIEKQKQIALQDEIVNFQKHQLKPNKMQTAFIVNLKKLIDSGEEKALLISATGTGKTYASAFAMRELGFKKVLFLVHREQILKQAKRSYQRVLPANVTTGLLSGNYKDINADFLFSTVQTMSRDYILNQFGREQFDCVIIDETHKAGAETYKKIIDYFQPKLLLGMTASPERTDGFDIYKLFDNNIVHEIRLQDALQEDLLCPFHYFGISDLEVEGQVIGDNTEFRYLASDARVDHILEQANYYGYAGNRVKGLIFCSRNEEAKVLSQALNARGYKTVALSGDNSQEERELAVERLEMDCEVDSNQRPLNPQALDYIITVDIFNEGVVVQEVNHKKARFIAA